MKTIGIKRAFVVLLAAAALFASGCKVSGTAQNSAGSGSQPSGMNQVANGVRGVILEVSATSVTVAVMPQGQGGPPAQPQPSGNPGQGGGQGSAPAGATPMMDTSSWQKETFVIDSGTKILQGQAPGSSGSASSLKASDLKVGDSVLIAERTGAAKTTADTITVLQGMGAAPGGQGPQGGPQGSAPAATSKS